MNHSVAGAFGFRIAGIPPTPWLQLLGAEELPELRCPPATTPDQAVQPGLGRMIVPLVLPTAQHVVHAGAVVIGKTAWLVVGPREAGKSTLLHAAHQHGLTVVTDDTSIIDDDFVLTGPRCLDLRKPVPGGVLVRDGQRYRATLDPVPWRFPLGGMVYLSWCEDVSGPQLIRLSAGERLAALADQPRLEPTPNQAVGLLDLAAKPAFALSRSRHGQVEDTVAVLTTVGSFATNREDGDRNPLGQAA